MIVQLALHVIFQAITHSIAPTLAHLVVSGAAHAGAVLAAPVVAAAKTLPEVIDGMRAWVMGILAAVATLFLVIGGLRYMAAAGDPAQIEQAKGSFKAALTGYALAVLAPVILQALQGILGG